MVLNSFTSKVSQGLEKAFKNQYGMRDVSDGNGMILEKSMKAWVPGYRSYDKYGQEKTGTDFHLTPETLRRMYQYNCVVRMAVDAIINEVTSAKWDIMPKEKDDNIEKDKVKQEDQKKRIKEVKGFFEKPNKNKENFRTILEKMMRDLLLLDAGVIVKSHTPQGRIAEIYAADGGTIKIDADRHGMINCFWQVIQQEGLKPLKLESNEVIYLMMNPSTNSLYGLSPLETLHNIVTAFLYGETYNLKYFENSSTPRGILDLGPAITEDQLDRFRTYWQSETIQQPHRTFVVGGASAGSKWTAIAMTPKDMEFNNYMNWLLKVILAVFGVSPSEAGWTEDLRGAPATGQLLQSQAFKNKSIYPMMDKISYYLTRDIIWDEFGYDDLKFEFIEEISLQEKMLKGQYDNMRVMSGIMSVDEIRKESGLSPKPKEEEGMGGMFGGGEEEEEDFEASPEKPNDPNQTLDLVKKELNKNSTNTQKMIAKAFNKLRFEVLRGLVHSQFLNENKQ